jgi:hypothetical protein
MLRKLLARYSRNYQLLQEAAETLGTEYERNAYEELCGGSLDGSHGEWKYKGVAVSYTAYSFNVKKNGDVGFCIDLSAKIPTFLGIKPSHQFYKTRDGHVYY